MPDALASQWSEGSSPFAGAAGEVLLSRKKIVTNTILQIHAMSFAPITLQPTAWPALAFITINQPIKTAAARIATTIVN